jgi:hypothetical protein
MPASDLSKTQAADQLAQLREHLHTLRSSDASAATFVQHVRALSLLPQALPEKYGVVLNDTLDRLESSALFSCESCSFSQRDLLDGLQLWCEKAQAQLSASLQNR